MMDAPDPLVQVVKDYEKAVNARSFEDLMQLVAFEDPRFSEIEDHIPHPFGRDVFVSILQHIADHPESSYRCRYDDILTHRLSDEVGYAYGVHQWTNDQEGGSARYTFILIRQEGRWKILHGHWSELKE